MAAVAGFGALVEQQRLEGTIARIRWGAVALTLVLGPTFPSLSAAAVVGLGVAVAAYNLLVLRLSARAATVESHRRIGWIAFGADLVALAVAMFLFSSDPYWTTFFIGTLVIIGGAFRFGTAGAWTSAIVLTVAYVAITIFRARYFGIPIEPQRSLFHLSVFGLTALLIDRVLSDVGTMRGEREDLIRVLERRIGEDAALATALRVVARGPRRAPVPDVLEACRGVFHFDRATVFVEDLEGGAYKTVHRIAAPDDIPAPQLRLGEGLVGSALATGRTILLGNVLDDPRYRRRPEGEHPRSLIIVPLYIRGRATAALSLSRSRPDAFGPDDVRLAEIIGGLIAQVIENERLFAEASEAEALREMDQLKDEFLAAVSHDLRTPLTVISGSLELLAKDAPASERATRLIDQAERHVRRLQRMVEDLLTLAQLQEARIELEREFISPGALLADVALTHEPVAATRSQTIRVVSEEGLPPILVDRRRMAQVLGDLVDNASRYSPDGTAIELRAEHDGSGARLAVVDEGPGVPVEERERVFDKFYRGVRTRARTKGTGLGLAIARNLVEMHGGRIRVEDAPRRGARFVVTIPHESVPALAVAK
jgi:signal transduction histidine kinase